MWSLLDSANNSGVPLEELLDEVNQVNDIPGINPVNRASSLENAPALQKWVGRGISVSVDFGSPCKEISVGVESKYGFTVNKNLVTNSSNVASVVQNLIYKAYKESVSESGKYKYAKYDNSLGASTDETGIPLDNGGNPLWKINDSIVKLVSWFGMKSYDFPSEERNSYFLDGGDYVMVSLSRSLEFLDSLYSYANNNLKDTLGYEGLFFVNNNDFSNLLSGRKLETGLVYPSKDYAGGCALVFNEDGSVDPWDDLKCYDATLLGNFNMVKLNAYRMGDKVSDEEQFTDIHYLLPADGLLRLKSKIGSVLYNYYCRFSQAEVNLQFRRLANMVGSRFSVEFWFDDRYIKRAISLLVLKAFSKNTRSFRVSNNGVEMHLTEDSFLHSPRIGEATAGILEFV